MQNFKSQMKKMDLMKPISLSLDGQGTNHNNTNLSKVNTTLCYDLMQDHEESMILNRSVNHPVAITHQGTESFLHIYESDESDSQNGDLIIYTKQNGKLHPWSKNVISNDIKQLSTFKDKSKVVKFATHKSNYNDTTSMAVVLESTEQQGLVELFFTPKLEINQNSCKTRWTKHTLAGNVNITRNFHIVLSENLHSDSDEVVILLTGQSQNSDFISGYVNCFNPESGLVRTWKQLPERGEKEILEVKEVYRQFDQGFYFLAKDSKDSKGKVIYYNIDRWLESSGSITSNTFSSLEKQDISAMDSVSVMDDGYPVSHLFYATASEGIISKNNANNAIYHASPETQNRNFDYPEIVHDDLHVTKVINIAAVQDGDSVFSTYSVDEQSALHRANNKNHNPAIDEASGNWYTTKIHNNVVDIAALGQHSNGGPEAEVFLVTGGNNLGSNVMSFERLYKTASAWKQEHIMSEHEDREVRHKLVSDTTMNVVKISFKDHEEQPVAFKKPATKDELVKAYNVKVNTSQAVSLKIHNVHYHLNADQSLTVPVSPQGTLDIGVRSSKLISPILTINAEFLKKSFSFDPMVDSYDRINAMREVRHYKNPHNRFGEKKPSLVPNISDEVLNSSMKAIKQLHKASRSSQSKHFIQNLTQYLAKANQSELNTAQDAAEHRIWIHEDGGHSGINNLNITHNTEFDDIGFELKPNKVVSLMKSGTKTISLNQESNFIWTTIADIFHRIEHSIEENLSVFFKKVGNTIRVILEVAGKMFTAVLKTIEDVFSAIFNIFASVLKIAENLLIDILSMILPWEDIRKVYEMLSEPVKKTFKDVPGKIDNAAKQIDGFFGKLEDQFKKAQKVVNKLPDKGQFNSEYIKSQQVVRDKEQEASWLNLQHNPVFNSISGKIPSAVSNAPNASAVAKTPPVGKDIIGYVENFINNNFIHFLHEEKEQIKHFVDTIKDSHLQMTNAVDAFRIIFEAGVVALLESTRNVTKLFFDLMKLIAHEIYNVMFETEFYLPFFTSIFKSEKCLASKEAGSALSLMIMAISVPVTLIIKLVKNDILSSNKLLNSSATGWNKEKLQAFVAYVAGACSIAFASVGAVSSITASYFDLDKLPILAAIWTTINNTLSFCSIVFYVVYIATAASGSAWFQIVADVLLILALCIQLVANLVTFATIAGDAKGKFFDFLRKLNIFEEAPALATVLVIITDILVVIGDIIVCIISIIAMFMAFEKTDGEKEHDQPIAAVTCGFIVFFTTGEIIKLINTVLMALNYDPVSRTETVIFVMSFSGGSYLLSTIGSIITTIMVSNKPFEK